MAVKTSRTVHARGALLEDALVTQCSAGRPYERTIDRSGVAHGSLLPAGTGAMRILRQGYGRKRGAARSKLRAIGEFKGRSRDPHAHGEFTSAKIGECFVEGCGSYRGPAARKDMVPHFVREESGGIHTVESTAWKEERIRCAVDEHDLNTTAIGLARDECRGIGSTVGLELIHEKKYGRVIRRAHIFFRTFGKR